MTRNGKVAGGLLALTLSVLAGALWWPAADRTLDLGPLDVAGLDAAFDTLGGRTARVGLGGHVADQGAGGALYLSDGTGFVRVDVPAPVPPLVGHRLLVSGLLHADSLGRPAVQAEAWSFDSLAVEWPAADG